VLVTGNFFQPSPMFVGKAGDYFSFSPLGEALDLTGKHYTSIKNPHRDKHSSFFQKFINYECLKFNNIESRLCIHKTSKE